MQTQLENSNLSEKNSEEKKKKIQLSLEIFEIIYLSPRNSRWWYIL